MSARRTIWLSLLLLALFVASAPLAGARDRYSGPQIELFDDRDYRGERRVYFAERGNLASDGFNDTARSVRIVSGTWELCEDAGFGGRCVRLSRNEPNLFALGVSRAVSSLRPVSEDRDDDWDAPRGARLELYETEFFGGRTARLSESLDNLSAAGFNDVARSLRAKGRWQVCEDAWFSGRCHIVEGEIADLRTIGLWGAISSARPHSEADDDWGGWEDGRGRADGRTASFFPAPTRRGAPLIACLDDYGRGCARATADDFCVRKGFRSAGHFALARFGRDEVIEDLLCLR